jgi:hypothetical protein
MHRFEERMMAMSLEELLDETGRGELGSRHDQFLKALLQIRIAKLQQDAAGQALRWARLSSISTAVATTIAVVALLVSLFHG